MAESAAQLISRSTSDSVCVRELHRCNARRYSELLRAESEWHVWLVFLCGPALDNPQWANALNASNYSRFNFGAEKRARTGPATGLHSIRTSEFNLAITTKTKQFLVLRHVSDCVSRGDGDEYQFKRHYPSQYLELNTIRNSLLTHNCAQLNGVIAMPIRCQRCDREQSN